jgi:hypothetical protein
MFQVVAWNGGAWRPHGAADKAQQEVSGVYGWWSADSFNWEFRGVVGASAASFPDSCEGPK